MLCYVLVLAGGVKEPSPTVVEPNFNLRAQWEVLPSTY